MSRLNELQETLNEINQSSEAAMPNKGNLGGYDVSTIDYETDDIGNQFASKIDQFLDVLSQRYGSDYDVTDFNYDKEQKMMRIKVVPGIDSSAQQDIADIFGMVDKTNVEVKDANTVHVTFAT